MTGGWGRLGTGALRCEDPGPGGVCESYLGKVMWGGRRALLIRQWASTQGTVMHNGLLGP